eukprot:4683815-Amphidinium_carterae.1
MAWGDIEEFHAMIESLPAVGERPRPDRQSSLAEGQSSHPRPKAQAKSEPAMASVAPHPLSDEPEPPSGYEFKPL